jgi:hypothetical protein
MCQHFQNYVKQHCLTSNFVIITLLFWFLILGRTFSVFSVKLHAGYVLSRCFMGVLPPVFLNVNSNWGKAPYPQI